MKVLHPKEAIDQIGLTRQQIKFNLTLKVKAQSAKKYDRDLIDVIHDLIQT